MTEPTDILLTLLKLAGCLVLLTAGYALLMTLIRAFLSFVDKAVDTAVALFFYVVIVPPLWLWEKGRRPMWRTLTKQQSREIEAWLRRG